MMAGRQAGRTALVTGAARGPMIHGEVVRHYFQTTADKSINHDAMPVPAIEPDDVADAVAWLLSDEARYITGVSLPADTGMMLI